MKDLRRTQSWDDFVKHYEMGITLDRDRSRILQLAFWTCYVLTREQYDTVMGYHHESWCSGRSTPWDIQHLIQRFVVEEQ